MWCVGSDFRGSGKVRMAWIIIVSSVGTGTGFIKGDA